MIGFKNVMMIGGLVALVTWGGEFLAWADPGSGHDPHGNPPHADVGPGDDDQEGMGYHDGLSPLAMKEVLGLSDEQVTRLPSLEMEYRKSMIQNGADLEVAMVDLGTLYGCQTTRLRSDDQQGR